VRIVAPWLLSYPLRQHRISVFLHFLACFVDMEHWLQYDALNHTLAGTIIQIAVQGRLHDFRQ
jgi:hypothetical protein